MFSSFIENRVSYCRIRTLIKTQTTLYLLSFVESPRKFIRTKKRICIKFALCKYVANMSFAPSASVVMAEFARFCANSAIATFALVAKLLCTGCKALRISYLQHICTRQIWDKFDFSSSDIYYCNNNFTWCFHKAKQVYYIHHTNCWFETSYIP